MKQILSNTILYTKMCEFLADEKTPTYMVIYNYDATGRPIGMSYRENSYGQYQWDVYWFDLICRAI